MKTSEPTAEYLIGERLGRLRMKTKMKTIARLLPSVVFLVSALGTLAGAQDRVVNVAAAADLSAAFKEIAANFEKQKGIEVKVSFGASGALTQQIENGAPFDIFFSADMGYPQQLIAEGHASSATVYRYAVGKLVLWAPAGSPLDFERQGMNALLDPSVQKIAIANPQHAPYGRAAMAALKHAGLYEKVASRLVQGENISQAAQFVESGNAQVGFVALAHAIAPEMKAKGKYWLVQDDAYPPLDQGAILLAHSPHSQEAAEFMEFVKAKETVSIMQRYGFTMPDTR